MNSLVFGTLTFLVVLPAISICDEDLTKASESPKIETESATINPSIYDIYDNDGTEYINEVDDPWSFYRQLRGPSGFSAVRGKKAYEPEAYWELDNDDEIISKRAPPQEFFGMRGKKHYDYQNTNDFQAQLYQDLQDERERIANIVENYLEEKQKRKPSGFVGLRGKKSINVEDYYENEKRAPMGFQGVRGKKSEYPNFIRSEDKRVPVTGFFGMRGKKQPVAYQSSNFFGVRKKPYLPYAKFVGVRGKKAEEAAVKRLLMTQQEFDQTRALQPAARVSSDTQQDKRLGFIGMRG